MSEWKEKKLSEIVFLHKDTFKPDKESSLKYIGLEHIEQGSLRILSFGNSASVESNKFYFQKGDVLFGKLRPYFRKVIKAPFDGVCSTDIWVCRATDGNCQDYIFYFLANQKFIDEANSSDEGTRMPRADWSYLKNTSWMFPPLQTQRAIAEILSSLDDKIDLLTRQNATLEALAQTYFRQWFVEEASEKQEKKNIGDYVETTIGGDWGNDKFSTEYSQEVYCIRGTDIADLLTGIATKIPIRFIKPTKYEKIKLCDRDIILEISGGTDNQSTGRTIYINQDIQALFELPLVFSNFCRCLRLKHSHYVFMIHLLLKYLYQKDEMFNLENGSTGIKNLDYKALLYSEDYKMSFPSEESIILFDEKICVFFEKVNRNKTQILTLQNLRDTLLPKLVSGEVGVRVKES
jgi:type I restriction enzyme S subunit